MSDEQAHLRVGQVIANKYRLERLLGAGGMGAVYAATHAFTKRAVAVKLMHETFAKSKVLAERFISEAQAPGAIGHPSIVEVLDGGVDDDGSLYLVLEMLQGKTLGDLEHPLEVADLIEVTTQLLDALSAAHRAGFVHRDIKPDNIFLTHDASGRRRVKLLDFGVAGVRDENVHLTQTGTILGTPTFMSPEQARGDRVDHRSDLWAVGAILYDALAGRPPYEAETYNAVIVSIVTREHVPLERMRPDLPRALLDVIERALRKNVDQRWQSADEMGDALRAIEGLDGIRSITKQMVPEAVAATQVARRRASNRPPAAAAPGLDTDERRGADTQDAAHSATQVPSAARPPTPSAVGAHIAVTSVPSLPRPPRNATTVGTPTPSASRSAVLLWVGATVALVAFVLAAAAWASQQRRQAYEPMLQAAAAAPVVAAPATDPTPPPTPAAAPAATPSPAAPQDNAPAPAPEAAPTPSPEPIKPLNADDLGAALGKGQARLEHCYQTDLSRQLAAGQEPRGLQLNVTLAVSSRGQVGRVDIEGRASAELQQCLRQELERFTFRATDQATDLSFPVVFQPTVIGQ